MARAAAERVPRPATTRTKDTFTRTRRGYIVDVSLKGTSVEPDADDMEAAYGEGTSPADVLQVREWVVGAGLAACW
jgi:hypothetical protein